MDSDFVHRGSLSCCRAVLIALAKRRLPQGPSQPGRPLRPGRIDCSFRIAHVVFGSYPVTTEVGRDENNAWIDVILYHGLEKDIDFRKIPKAAVVFALSLNPRNELAEPADPHALLRTNSANDLIIADWDRPSNRQMSLSVPAKPMPSTKQRDAAIAGFGAVNPWKAPAQQK